MQRSLVLSLVFLSVLLLWNNNYYRFNSKTIKTEKVTVIFRELSPKNSRTVTVILHHGTKPSDRILGPQLTDPTFCRNLNATPLTHPTFGCVSNANPLKTLHVATSFRPWNRKSYVLLHFHCSDGFQCNDSFKSMFCNVFKCNHVWKPLVLRHVLCHDP